MNIYVFFPHSDKQFCKIIMYQKIDFTTDCSKLQFLTYLNIINLIICKYSNN